MHWRGETLEQRSDCCGTTEAFHVDVLFDPDDFNLRWQYNFGALAAAMASLRRANSTG